MPTMIACYMIAILIGALSIVKPRLLVINTHTIYWHMYTLLYIDTCTPNRSLNIAKKVSIAC